MPPVIVRAGRGVSPSALARAQGATVQPDHVLASGYADPTCKTVALVRLCGF